MLSIRQFLGTGKGDVDKIKKICNETDFEFDSCSPFLEYGSGVGRLVVNKPDSIKEINCVDFSSLHLAEAGLILAKQNMQQFARCIELAAYMTCTNCQKIRILCIP